MNKKLLFLINLMLLGLVSGGCTEFPDCQNPYTPYARAGFFSKSTQQPISVTYNRVSIEDNGEILHEQDTLSVFQLPLNPTGNQTTFEFDNGGGVETLVLTHSSKVRILSPDCGPYQYFYNISLLSTTFDSVVVNSSVADLNLPVNVSVFR
jgi:hypothetical protein